MDRSSEPGHWGSPQWPEGSAATDGNCCFSFLYETHRQEDIHYNIMELNFFLIMQCWKDSHVTQLWQTPDCKPHGLLVHLFSIE